MQQNVLQQKYSKNSTIDGLYNTWSYPLNDTCSPCHACETCGKPLIQTCKTKTSTTFYSHFFKGNTRSFLNSLHLHLLVQHLEEKNPFIPSQDFNHFSFMLVILALLPFKETKNEAMVAKGKLSSLLYCCKSLFPSQSIPQQTFPEVQNVPPQKFCSRKCKSFGRLFAAEFVEFQKCRMFICIIFYSKNFIRKNVDYLQ